MKLILCSLLIATLPLVKPVFTAKRFREGRGAAAREIVGERGAAVY